MKSRLERQFARIGARVTVRPSNRLSVDIRNDRHGKYFDIAIREPDAPATALDVQPRNRHLLLAVHDAGLPFKFLCGHDERHWFVAAVPERKSVTSVQAAMDALKPPEVLQAEFSKRVKRRDRFRRHNAAFIRQGEWFFVPAPNLIVSPLAILHDEPLSRGGRSKPHWAEELYRIAGQRVIVSAEYTQGISEEEYRQLLIREPSKRQAFWRWSRRDALVYVRGRFRHDDHKTIRLDDWHRVFVNTEHTTPARSHLAFID